MNILRHLLLVALMLVVGVLAACGKKATDQRSAALVVVFGAKDVEFTHYHGNDEVTYRVDRPFPATDVIHEIVEKMGRQGWQPMQEDYLNPGKPSSLVCGWFSSGTEKNHLTLVRQSWVNDWSDSKGNVVRYLLTYEYAENGKEITNLDIDATYTSAAVVSQVKDKIHFIKEHQKKL